MDKTFSVAIFKKQLPECCTPIDLVMAMQAQFGENDIDMIQSINGLYRIDFNRKEPHTKIFARGLSLLSLTIPVSLWRDGMDCPQVRLVVGPLPKEISNMEILEALEKCDLLPVTVGEYDYWKDKVTGKQTKIKTGKRIFFIKKTNTPIPDKVIIKDREAPIWFWGKSLSLAESKRSGNIFRKEPEIVPKEKKDNKDKNEVNPKYPSSQQADDDIIGPTPPLADIFKIPGHKQADEQPRGRERARRSSSKRRSLSRDYSQSPSKARKYQDSNTPSSSPLANKLNPKNPGEATGEEIGS